MDGDVLEAYCSISSAHRRWNGETQVLLVCDVFREDQPKGRAMVYRHQKEGDKGIEPQALGRGKANGRGCLY